MSPPLSIVNSHSGSHATLTASDAEESAYLLRNKVFHWIRTSLSALIFIIAIVVIGCEAHSLQYYKETNPFREWGLPLWPQGLDLRPTTALIASGAVIAGLTLTYLVVACIPSPHARIILLNTLISLVAVGGLIASIAAMAFTSTVTDPRINNSDNIGETIRSWTCKYSFRGGLDHNGQLVEATGHFGRLCVETSASFSLMSLLIALEAILTVGAAVGWWLEVGMERKRGAGGVEEGKGGY
ncbi:hypothetical protein FQN50_000217 [Emmonsiellopsis sp. PD_5]|nr:hypothetical protein FQN50_000217 [Emmonsiellopsis sp. PD_5]